MRALVLCVLVFGARADEPKENVVKTHHKQLQGTWKITSLEVGGKVTLVKQDLPTFDLTFTGTRMAVGGVEKGEVVLNPTVAPHAIDLKFPKDQGTAYGIYKLEGDTLTLCVRRGKGEPKDRPKGFTTKDTTDIEIRVYKRDQPKK